MKAVDQVGLHQGSDPCPGLGSGSQGGGHPDPQSEATLLPSGGSWTPFRTCWKFGTLHTEHWTPAQVAASSPNMWDMAGQAQKEDQGQALEAPELHLWAEARGTGLPVPGLQPLATLWFLLPVPSS